MVKSNTKEESVPLSLFLVCQGGDLTVEVVGSSGVAAAWGLHHYLQQHCGAQVNNVMLPEPKELYILSGYLGSSTISFTQITASCQHYAEGKISCDLGL